MYLDQIKCSVKLQCEIENFGSLKKEPTLLQR